MMITDYEQCPDCGQELKLLTDGRQAEVSATYAYYAAPEHYERELGGILHLSCPVIDTATGYVCTGVVTFTGEGVSTDEQFSVDARDIKEYRG